jgi:hypothetical protein
MHERLGTQAAVAFGFADAWNLRAQDFGELTVSAIAGFFLGGGLAAAVYRSSAAFRQASLDLFALLVLLVFFGVVLDVAVIAIDLGSRLNQVLFFGNGI